MNKYYKRLKKNGENFFSPFQTYQWKIGKKVVCGDFNTDKNVECSTGLYYLKPHQLLWETTLPLFEVEIGGEKIEFQNENRCSEMKVLREVPEKEIRNIAKSLEPELGFKYEESLFPINPFTIKPKLIGNEEISLLKEWVSVRNSIWDSIGNSVRNSVGNSIWNSVWDSIWNSVWDSIGNSVWNSVRNSIWDSIGNSVRNSVRNSIWDSIYAYIGSLFPNIAEWKYFENKDGKYPFQSVVDLWYRGIVSLYDDKTWRLLSGKKAEIIYEEQKNINN